MLYDNSCKILKLFLHITVQIHEANSVVNFQLHVHLNKDIHETKPYISRAEFERVLVLSNKEPDRTFFYSPHLFT